MIFFPHSFFFFLGKSYSLCYNSNTIEGSGFMFLKSAYFPGFEFFTKKTCIHNYYPARVLTKLDIKEMELSGITIFYGNNGSGKSTLLNLISEKIMLLDKQGFLRMKNGW